MQRNTPYFSHNLAMMRTLSTWKLFGWKGWVLTQGQAHYFLTIYKLFEKLTIESSLTFTVTTVIVSNTNRIAWTFNCTANIFTCFNSKVSFKAGLTWSAISIAFASADNLANPS